jgi:predicted nucleic acid-binding protein
MADNVVLDTSAIIAVLEAEPEASRVVELLQNAGRSSVRIHVAFVSLMETEYILLRRLHRERVDAAIFGVESWPIEVAESTPEWRRAAAEIKAHGRLSFADAWIASLAVLKGGALLHKDKEFDSVPGLRSVRL